MKTVIVIPARLESKFTMDNEERFEVVGNRSAREPFSIRDTKKKESIAILYDIEWAQWVCGLLNDNDDRRDDYSFPSEFRFEA